MRYEPLGKEFYSTNRSNFCKAMKPNSIAIFHSNDKMPTNADGLMPFRQNNDILYLSGMDQEKSILVLFPDFPDEKRREILFLQETSDLIAIWEGHKFTKEEANEISGVPTIMWLDQFEAVLNVLMAEAENVYVNTNEHYRAVVEVETRDARLANWLKGKYPAHTFERAAPLMHELRAIKSKEEIAVLQHACNITNQGFRRLLEFVKPGVWEYEIEAELMHEFLRNRSRGFAYEPIIASGFSACVLHYITNNKQCKDGDMLLLDVGAEYANYNADLTRTIPVNGRYTERQKAVYDAVLRVHQGAIKILRPGVLISEYQKEVEKMMEGELIGLGLLDKGEVAKQNPEQPLLKKYFMHGTSHHLGLDVHDVGNIYRRVEPGMVFTVEPGIYIREESLGVRLENDIVITEEGHIDLMADIPIETEEIEDLMNS